MQPRCLEFFFGMVCETLCAVLDKRPVACMLTPESQDNRMSNQEGKGLRVSAMITQGQGAPAVCSSVTKRSAFGWRGMIVFSSPRPGLAVPSWQHTTWARAVISGGCRHVSNTTGRGETAWYEKALAICAKLQKSNDRVATP